MTIQEAVAKNINKLRKPFWVNKEDYLLIDLIAGGYGPWGHFYSPRNEIIGQENPQHGLIIGDRATDWEEYKEAS